MSKNTARRLEEMDKSLSGINVSLTKFEDTLKKLDSSLEKIATSLGRKEQPSKGGFNFNLFSGNQKSVTNTGNAGGDKLMTELRNALDKNHKESFKIFQSMESLLKGIDEKLGKQAEGGGGGSPLPAPVPSPGTPDKAKKGVLGKVGSVLGKVALPLAAVMAGMEAHSGYTKAGETLDLEPGQEPTFGQKLAGAGAGVMSGLTFGMIDEKKMAHTLAGTGKGKEYAAAEQAKISGLSSGGDMFDSGPAPDLGPVQAAAPEAKTSKPVGSAAAAALEATVSKPAGKETKSASVSTPAASKIPSASKGPSAKEKMQGEENLQKLEEKEAELQTVQREYKDEIAKASEKLANDTKNYPQGFIDDPSDPEYPKELKAVDDKYKPKIEALKKEIFTLSKAPGIEGAKKAQAAADAEDDEKPSITPKTKVTGGSSVEKTTSTETVTGGGETTSKRTLTPEAEAAQKELAGIDDKQAAEKKQVIDKLKAEGKITGGPEASDYETIPELKELKTKQDAELAAISAKIDSGTNYETSTIAPPPQTTTTATTVSSLSAENKDLSMEASKGGAPSVVSSNNVQNNNTTSFTPFKPLPRGGLSSLERKQDTVSA